MIAIDSATMMSQVFSTLVEVEIFGNSILAWLAASGVAGLAFVAAIILRRSAGTRLRAIAARTASPLDDFLVSLLGKAHGVVLAIAAAYVGSRMLTLPQEAQRIITSALMVAVAVQVLVWTHQFVNFAIHLFLHKRGHPEGQADAELAAAANIARFLLLLTAYAIILLFVLSNIGVDITAWVTGVGIGGIAIALAVQSVLGDLFASLSIVLDKPFVVGDFIIVGDKMGTVDRVGIKTTRVRALSGEQLVFANSDLLSSRIQNFKRMSERRVLFAVGVEYRTPLEKLKVITSIISAAITSQHKTRFDRCHFKGFGPSSLEFEAVYFVQDRDFNLHMDIQQAINLEIVRRFEDEGIEFAYPTQTLYLRREHATQTAIAGRSAG